MPDDTKATPDPTGTATLDKPEPSPAPPPEAEKAPLAPESPAKPAAQEPEKWDAARWEKFGHRLMSKAANGEDVVALLKDVPLDDAPGAIRTMLSGLTAAGETPEPAPAPPPPTIEPERLRPGDIRGSRQYRLDEYRALRGAATEEEEREALAEVEAKHADTLVDEGMRMLEAAGHDLSPYWKPELTTEDEERINVALKAIPGLKVPERATDVDDAVAFINSVRRYVRSRPAGSEAVEKATSEAVAKAIEKYNADLELLAEREGANQGIAGGELATGAGAGTVTGPDLSNLAGLTDARRRGLINSEEFLKRWADLTQGLGGI